MARRCSGPSLAPLLVWQDLHAIEELRQQRLALARRVEALPPHAHRRVELEARLRLITNELMRAEAALHQEGRR